ncbi:hypothetical protein I3760_04G183400 [Carya illinoinensis]|nr:hypothetical protein I3760_04G183400 [Carya illinoinensis]
MIFEGNSSFLSQIRVFGCTHLAIIFPFWLEKCTVALSKLEPLSHKLQFYPLTSPISVFIFHLLLLVASHHQFDETLKVFSQHLKTKSRTSNPKTMDYISKGRTCSRPYA